MVCVAVAFTPGCGPVALAIEGGTAGGLLATRRKSEDKRSNSAPVVIINALVREDSPATIQYSLLDSEGDPCGVTIQYRVGSGAFANCTQGPGGDSTSNLASSKSGTPHTFKWDFVADLGSTSLVTDIALRVAANDGRQGNFAQLDNLAIGNDAPTVSGISSSESAGLFLVTFALSDTSSDIGAVAVAYSIDQAQTWNDLNPTGSDFFGNPPLNLLSSPTGAPAQFIWNSPVALPNFDGDVFLRLVPSDTPAGYTVPTEGAAVVYGPIRVRNTANTGPRLNVLTPLTGAVAANRLRVEFTLADDQSNPGEVYVEWSPDGTIFSTATLANQTLPGVAGPFVTNPAPSRYEFIWEAVVDFQATPASEVFLRLTPRDSVNGVAQLFGPLTVFGNTAPAVRAVSVTGITGVVQVTVNLQDANSDRVGVVAELLVGGTPVALSAADFSGADLTNLRSSPSGEDNVLLWDTSLALGASNSGALALRFTPTDLPATFPTGALTGAAFTSERFSIVNSGGSGSAVARVAVAAPATVNFGSGFVFSTQVLPSSASPSVTLAVVEGPAYGSIVPLAPPNFIYFAPVSPPAAYRPYVTLRATSNSDPSIFGEARVYWGDVPVGVIVTPSGQSLLLGDSLAFAAQVLPASAPQTVSWRVVEGTVAGSIDANGHYHAPLTMPPSSTVTIRATAVNGATSTTTLTLAPRPHRVIVTAPASTLALDATLQFTAQVNPAPDTIQDVRWRVVFDGEDRGSGDAQVGFISPTGLYTAPHFLPRPITVQIEASASALPAVSGRTTLTLVAPLPASFDISPPTATLIAGGRGQQFTLDNLLPDNASSAVIWTRTPALGTIDTEGRYTPPATLASSTVILITATSAVAGGVTASASVTLMPQTGDIPQSVTILPNTAVVAAGGMPVRFSAVVNPPGAPQAVSWRVVSGGGSINSQGVFTPPALALDGSVVLRASSDANGSVFTDYTLAVAGSGNAWNQVNATAMGRDQPSGFFDAINNYFWIIGGKSEASGSRHDTGVFAYDLASNRWRAFAPVGQGAFHNTISAALDEVNGRIIAVVGDDLAQARLFTLDLNVPTAGWSSLAAGGGANAPVLPGNFRYLTFWHPGTAAPGDERLIVIKDGVSSHTAYTLNTSTDTWLAPVTFSANSGPKEPRHCACVYHPTLNAPFLIGEPGEIAPTSGINVWRVNLPALTFTAQAQVGAVPSGFLNGAQLAFDSSSGLVLVFGGERGQAGYSSQLLTLNLNTPGLASWGAASLSGESIGARAFGAMAVSGSRALVFGGRNGAGAFGDLWDFDITSVAAVTTSGLSPIDFMPQGRRFAACAWVPSLDEGYCFGGLCAHGESNELWVVRYDAGTASTTWTRVAPAGSAPPALAGASLALDAARGRLLLYGGFAGAAVFTDVYAFDLATRQWSQLAPAGIAPAPRWAACAWLEGNRLFIYGGKQNADLTDLTSGLAGDTHVLDFTADANGAWLALSTFSAPDARLGATAGFDGATNRLIIFGGYTRESQSSGQLYALDVSTGQWGALGISNAQFAPGVFGGAAAYDAQLGRFLAAPAHSRQGRALVLSQPKAAWQQLGAADREHAFGAGGLFDPAAKRFITVFGAALQYGVEAGSNAVSVIEFR